MCFKSKSYFSIVHGACYCINSIVIELVRNCPTHDVTVFDGTVSNRMISLDLVCDRIWCDGDVWWHYCPTHCVVCAIDCFDTPHQTRRQWKTTHQTWQMSMQCLRTINHLAYGVRSHFATISSTFYSLTSHSSNCLATAWCVQDELNAIKVAKPTQNIHLLAYANAVTGHEQYLRCENNNRELYGNASGEGTSNHHRTY